MDKDTRQKPKHPIDETDGLKKAIAAIGCFCVEETPDGIKINLKKEDELDEDK